VNLSQRFLQNWSKWPCSLAAAAEVEVVTAPVVAVEGAEAVVVAGEGVGAALMVVDTVVVALAAVEAEVMEVAEDATGGELRLIAAIRLILRDWSQFGLPYRSALISL